MRRACIEARGRRLDFPAFFPVTTFGGRFPLDELVRPYLARLSQGVMVSYHYAQHMRSRPETITFIDSGGFASLFDDSRIIEKDGLGVIVTKEGGEIKPREVLAFQENWADIGATLDFVVTPEMSTETADYRQAMSIRNAVWAIQAQRQKNLQLFASVQAWDAASAKRAMVALARYPFAGFALGGMVPRLKQPEKIVEIVRAIREVEPERPLHVFGIGRPLLIRSLIQVGASSFDSSSYVRAAVDGKTVSDQEGPAWVEFDASGSSPDTLGQVESRLGPAYLALEGECNRMALALNNLERLMHMTRM